MSPNHANHTAVHYLQFMRNLAKRHVLARVRTACGLTQNDLAKLLEISAISVQRIEQGTLKLSEELANRIQDKLDVSAEWLLANDSKIPPLSSRNAYWTKELYEFVQGQHFVVTETRLSGKPGAIQVHIDRTPQELADKLTDWYIAMYQATIAALLKAAEGSPRQGILIHRLNQALAELQKDFDLDMDTMAAYADKQLEAQMAFKEAAKEFSERETKQLWQKPRKPASPRHS
jgi:transcriptional regulator with XRE-family HTH domain